jgi:hypothetical protein
LAEICPRCFFQSVAALRECRIICQRGFRRRPLFCTRSFR